MFGRRGGLNMGRRRRGDGSPSAEPLPVRDNTGVTSSYAADYSMDGQTTDKSTLDPVLGPDERDHRGGDKLARGKNDISLLSNFDDVSSMNDSYCGANATTEFSSPVPSYLTGKIEESSDESLIRQDMTETDIQTVDDGNMYSTIGGLGAEKIAQFDIEQAVNRMLDMSADQRDENGVSRVLDVSADHTPENHKLSPTITKSASSDESDAPSLAPSVKSGFRDWVRDSPFWLKMLFAGSLFFLSIAFLLVVVGVYVATKSEASTSSASASGFYGDDAWFPDNHVHPTIPGEFFPPEVLFPIVPKPTAAPFPIVPKPTAAPVVQLFYPPEEPITSDPTQEFYPPEEPIVSDPATLAPTLSPTTSMPSSMTTPEWTTIYITSGMPPANKEFTDVLSTLPGTSQDSFLVHLGDWNNATDIKCDEDTFEVTSNLYLRSSVPVYFAIGDNEYNDCPDPKVGLNNWKKYFINFYRHWPSPPWQVAHQDEMSQEYTDFNENTLFVHNQAVFLTLNLVSGVVHDKDEFERRIEANLAWIHLAYTFYRDSVKTIIIFAHSHVLTNTAPNIEFYDTLFEKIEDSYYDVRFVLAHRGNGRWGLKQRYNGVKNLDVINVPAGMNPPLKLVVRGGQPIALQADWL